MPFEWLYPIGWVLTPFLILLMMWNDRRSEHKWNRKMIEIKKEIEEVGSLGVKAKHERDVAYMRLAAIQRIAAANFETDPHPYRLNPERMLRDMERIHEITQQGLVKESRGLDCEGC